MARGSNGKHRTTTNNSTQHDSHTEDDTLNISTAASSQQSSSVTTITSAKNDNPRGTANRGFQFSGTVESFNNYGDGLQDFHAATINSSRTGDSFNNLRSGSQTLRDAEIRCVDNSAQRTASCLPWKQGHVTQSGILHSFKNCGNGSQSFEGFKLN